MSKVADIRNLAVELLKQANIANGNVYNSKVTPAAIQNTPMVVCYTEQVQAVVLSKFSPAMASTVTFQIDLVVSYTNNWADDTDNLVEEVIQTLFSDKQWTGMFEVIDGYQVSNSFYGDGEKPLVTAGITVVGKVFQAY